MLNGHKIAEMMGTSALTTNENSLNNVLNKIQDSSVIFKIKHSEAGDMARCLRELSTLVRGPRFSSQEGQALTNTRHSSSRGSEFHKQKRKLESLGAGAQL